jgi:hypothetical protein
MYQLKERYMSSVERHRIQVPSISRTETVPPCARCGLARDLNRLLLVACAEDEPAGEYLGLLLKLRSPHGMEA